MGPAVTRKPYRAPGATRSWPSSYWNAGSGNGHDTAARVTGEITTTVAPELVAALQSMPETVGRREVDLLVN